jgi:SAM-dependent methyltransferase
MSRWCELTCDPNSPEAISYRSRTLKLAWRAPIVDRTKYLVDLCRARKVLDIGVVDHFAKDPTGNAYWLHGHIAGAAAYCLGIDVLADGIAALRARHYNVAVCDITTDRLDDSFDVLIAGEVIEHLGHMESLFAFAAAHINPGGRLVFTSPNAFYLTRFAQAIANRMRESVDHVGFVFPSGVAELAERQGFVLSAYRGIRLPPRCIGKILIKTLNTLSWNQDALCESYLYECVPVQHGGDQP